MFSKLLLSAALFAAGSTHVFAMMDDGEDGRERISRNAFCLNDTLGSKDHGVTKTKKFKEDTIKEVINGSAWYHKYSDERGRITLHELPGTALKSTTLKGFRVDMEGSYEDGVKFRVQQGEDTFASVRIDPAIAFMYPSQLAKALYLSATSGKRKVVQ